MTDHDTADDSAAKVEQLREKIGDLELPAMEDLENSLHIGVYEGGVAVMSLDVKGDDTSIQRREVCHVNEMTDVWTEKFAPYFNLARGGGPGVGVDTVVATKTGVERRDL